MKIQYSIIVSTQNNGSTFVICLFHVRKLFIINRTYVTAGQIRRTHNHQDIPLSPYT